MFEFIKKLFKTDDLVISQGQYNLIQLHGWDWNFNISVIAKWPEFYIKMKPEDKNTCSIFYKIVDDTVFGLWWNYHENNLWSLEFDGLMLLRLDDIFNSVLLDEIDRRIEREVEFEKSAKIGRQNNINRYNQLKIKKLNELTYEENQFLDGIKKHGF